MKVISLVYPLLGLRSVHEIAWTRAGIAAIIVNAVSGMFLVAVPAMLLLPFATAALAALLVILFGPLIGFVSSSLYSRLEWFVGARLGGKAVLGDLYRIFAWSFLPLSLALVLFPILYFFADELKALPENVKIIASSIPPLVIGYCSLRNYCSDVIAVQQFSRIRGAVSIVLTFALFLTVSLVAIGFLVWLLFKSGLGEDLRAILGLP